MHTNNGTSPETPAGPDHDVDETRKQDRIASNGDEYAHDNNASAEGNDASLIAGPAFTRRINPDGTVQAVPAHGEREAEATAAADAVDSAQATRGPNG